MNSTLKYRKGFTLIEVLLGLSLFSIIALTLYTMLASGIQIQRRADKSGDLFREINWTLDQLVRDIEGARVYDFSGMGEEFSAFEGERDSLICLRVSDEGLVWVRYALASMDLSTIERTVLGVRGFKPDSFTLTSSQETRSVSLIRHQAGFIDGLDKDSWEGGGGFQEVFSSSIVEDGMKFSYGYSSQDNGGVIWQDQWDAKTLPNLVRVYLTWQNEKGDRLVFSRDIKILAGGA